MYSHIFCSILFSFWFPFILMVLTLSLLIFVNKIILAFWTPRVSQPDPSDLVVYRAGYATVSWSWCSTPGPSYALQCRRTWREGALHCASCQRRPWQSTPCLLSACATVSLAQRGRWWVPVTSWAQPPRPSSRLMRRGLSDRSGEALIPPLRRAKGVLLLWSDEAEPLYIGQG